MSSFLGWNTTLSANTKLDNTDSTTVETPLLNIAVEASGLDTSEPDASLQLDSEQNSYTVDADGDSNNSDYVLDSDHSDSPRSPCSDQPESDLNSKCTAADVMVASKSCILRQRTDKSITKVSSTGNLRVYHKTDLKNKISAVEHRLLFLEKRLQQLEKKSTTKSDSSIPTAIKFVAGCLLLLHLGRCL